MRIRLWIGPYGFLRMIFHRFLGRNPMPEIGLWYGFRAFLGDPKPISLVGAPVPPAENTLKSVLMRKTIVFNLLLILGYYFILQVLVWLAMIFR